MTALDDFFLNYALIGPFLFMGMTMAFGVIALLINFPPGSPQGIRRALEVFCLKATAACFVLFGAVTVVVLAIRIVLHSVAGYLGQQLP